MPAPQTAAASHLPLEPLPRPLHSGDGAGPGGDWPNTTRLLPWLIAGFLAVLWLVPIDATTLPVKLPFDSTIDRFELLVLAMTWVLAIGAAGSYGPRWRRSKANIGLAVFLAIATASVLLNLTSIARAEELQLALKKLSLLGCYTAFFIIVATSLRRREIARFAMLLLTLAVIAAVGTVIEYRTGVNYFYHWAAKLPFASVAPEPPDPKYARPSIVGPTHHGRRSQPSWRW